jgi:hypothetical protein
MRRRSWKIFIIWQIVAEICALSPIYFFHMHMSLRTIVLVANIAGFLALMPGKWVSELIIAKTFLVWLPHLTVVEMGLLDIPVEIAVNLTVWLLLINLFNIFRKEKS